MSGLTVREAHALSQCVDAIIAYKNRNSRLLCSGPFLTLTEKDNPRYRELVKHPRALLAIRELLAHGAYSSPVMLYADLKLVFRNAQLFYPKSKEPFVDAQRMESVVDEVWDTTPGLPPIASFAQLAAGPPTVYTLPRSIGPMSSIEELAALTDSIHGTTAESESASLVGTPRAGPDEVATPPAKRRGPGRPPKQRGPDGGSDGPGTPRSVDRAGTPIDIKPFSRAPSMPPPAQAPMALGLAVASAPVPAIHAPASLPAPAALRIETPNAASSAPRPSRDATAPSVIELAADDDQFQPLPSELSTAFRSDPKTGELIWYTVPPAVVPSSNAPAHSLAYLEFRSRRAADVIVAPTARPKRKASEQEESEGAATVLEAL